jgi:hypothetical protein
MTWLTVPAKNTRTMNDARSHAYFSTIRVFCLAEGPASAESRTALENGLPNRPPALRKPRSSRAETRKGQKPNSPAVKRAVRKKRRRKPFR